MQCEVCGNSYENMLEIKFQGSENTYYFDCFECASFKLAPDCEVCGVKILGHGVQAENKIFCCAHCARKQGFDEIVDHK